jgi:hypothetical protein
MEILEDPGPAVKSGAGMAGGREAVGGAWAEGRGTGGVDWVPAGEA